MQRLVGVVSRPSKDTVRNDDDLADRLSRRYTVVILVVFAIIVVTRQYQGNVISCWTPPHFTRAHIKYTNNYCWVKNTYYLPLEYRRENYNSENPPSLLYYQWLPLIFLLQAFLFYIPSVVWHGLNSKAGVDADDIIASARRFQKFEVLKGESHRCRRLELLVKQINRFLKNPSHQSAIREQKFVPSWRFGLLHGNYLTGVFLLSKICYNLNVGLQLLLLNGILRTNYFIYGWEIVNDFFKESDSNVSVFPRVTMCDMTIRRVDNDHNYSVQCVLPGNMYAEKMYAFLWVWMLLVLIISVISFIIWICRSCLFRDRFQFIRNKLLDGHVVNLDAENRIQSTLLFRFVDQYLRQDGVLLFQLISHNTNGSTVMELIKALWLTWLETQPEFNDVKVPLKNIYDCSQNDVNQPLKPPKEEKVSTI